MYVPVHFREDHVQVLHETIRRIGIGALVTLGPDGLVASHLPMLLQAEPAPYGRLCGHMARNNPQWLSIAPDIETLAIFTGPEAYISPSWYPAKRRTGKVVPTWNYVAIHAYGVVRVFDDPDMLLAHVSELTDAHEIGRSDPWAVSDAPKNYVQKMLKQIVGFELTITRFEGKWKMSQNRDEEDRHGAAEGLRCEAGRAGAVVADLITPLNRD
jgi:transcriptional regulator